MNLTEVTIEGTLRHDGTLALDEKPNLSPGRVTVVLRQEVTPPAVPMGPQQNWFEFLQAARKRLEEAGHPFMNEEEVNAHIEWLREGDRIDDMLRELDEQGPKPGQPGC